MANFSIDNSNVDNSNVDNIDQNEVNYTSALITMAVLYLMMGFITCLNDTLVPFFKNGFDLTYAQSSLVQFYFFITYGIMSIPAGRLVGKIGYKKGIVVGFAIASLGAFLFYPASFLHQYSLFLMALFVLAIGIVLLQVAANPYITALGSPKTASSRLSLIQGMGSIGTTIAPIFGAYFILDSLNTRQDSSAALVFPYMGIAITLVLIALIVSKLNLPTIKNSSDAGMNHVTKLLSNRNLSLGIVAIFCYVGAEVAIGTFLTNYIGDVLSIPESSANIFVSIYWGSMLIGRLIGAFLLKFLKPSKVLMVSALFAFGFIGISIFSEGVLSAYSMVAVGFFNSIVFAIIFSLAVRGLGPQTTKASGYLSSAIVGGAVISYLQGVMIDNFNWSIAFMLPMACYAFIAFYGYFQHRALQKKSSKLAIPSKKH